MRTLVACIAAAILLGPEAVSAQDGFRFARGDAVRVVVWEDPDMTGDFEIMADGRIEHPLLQNVPVAGRPYAEVRADIIAYLGEFQKTPLVTITPLVRVSVGGAVHDPKIVSIDPRATLLELIGQAGGPTAEAKLDVVEIVRAGNRSRLRPWDGTTAVQSLVQLGIGSGDLVIVPERRSAFRDTVAPVAAFLGSLVGVATLIIQVSE